MTVEINLWYLLAFWGAYLVLALGGHFIGFRYWLNVWYARDCLWNARLAGDPRETISSRWGKAIEDGNRLALYAAKALFLEKHFRESINEKVGSRRVPVAMMVVGIVFVIVLAVVML